MEGKTEGERALELYQKQVPKVTLYFVWAIYRENKQCYRYRLVIGSDMKNYTTGCRFMPQQSMLIVGLHLDPSYKILSAIPPMFAPAAGPMGVNIPIAPPMGPQTPLRYHFFFRPTLGKALSRSR